MNILKIVTLNKHGDFEEVLFSSILSYLLNPDYDHGLKNILLNRIAHEVFNTEIGDTQYPAHVESEYQLGTAGKVDIFSTFANKIMAIEIKIWDRSAKNVSASNEPQLLRYCQHLAKEFKDKDWRFVFLIPTVGSPTCLEEFRKLLKSDGFKDKVKLMTWNPADPEIVFEDIPDSCITAKSIREIISDLLLNIKRVDLPLHTQWLLDSLCDIIPDLIEDTPDQGRFPNKSDLEKLPSWPILEAFFTAGGRWPISLHTAVGIPYGWGEDRLDYHGNSLYRIRTVTDYYDNTSEKESHLPLYRVEIELWPEVYEACRDSILHWLAKRGMDERIVKDGKHLDDKKKIAIKLVSIEKGTPISKEDVEELNTLLRDGFRKLAVK